jgi:hypothetical protein
MQGEIKREDRNGNSYYYLSIMIDNVECKSALFGTKFMNILKASVSINNIEPNNLIIHPDIIELYNNTEYENLEYKAVLDIQAQLFFNDSDVDVLVG